MRNLKCITMGRHRRWKVGTTAKLPRKHIDKIANTKVAGYSFCITGILWTNRRRIYDAIIASGGSIHTRVKRSTDYLVVGSNPGRTKLDKVIGTEITLLSEGGLRRMLGLE